LIAIRKKHPALRRGDYYPLYHHDRDGLYAFLRKYGHHEQDVILVAINNSDTAVVRNIPATHSGWHDGGGVRDLLSGKKFEIENHFVANLRLPARSGAILAGQ